MFTLNAINEFFKSEKSAFQIVETSIKGEIKTYHYCVKHNNGELGNCYETLDDVFKDLALYVYISNRYEKTVEDMAWNMCGVYNEKYIKEAEKYILEFQK